MKKLILLLLISLLMPITSISQITYNPNTGDSTVLITPIQLKRTNLIFNEHSKLLEENKEYQEQIISYKNIVTNYQKIDSINTIKSNIYNKELANKTDSINNLSKRLTVSKKRNRIKNWITGILSAITAFFIYEQFR